MNYKISKTGIKALLYSPSQEYEKELEAEIIKCGVNPKSIIIRYGYTYECLATATFNTITLDPIIYSESHKDPQAIITKEIIEKHILPSQPEAVKDRLNMINEIFSPDAQRFVFKHELGHIVYNYSYKKLIWVGIIGFVMTYFGILATLSTVHLNGLLSIFLGIAIASIIDLFLTYFSNLIFKSQEEKKADLFAAKHSSAQEINAAANFFEKFYYIQADANKIAGGLYSKIPSIILSGHYNGKTRAKYLRKEIDYKN
ncbi:MAG: M48 family metalloprotease [Candidatus Babeliales bacterium]|nr:M48 family metalloprotease [Candidatus Babeliales bacterium]